MLDIGEGERDGEGKTNRESEKKGVNVGQWGGGPTRKERKEGKKGRRWGRETHGDSDRDDGFRGRRRRREFGREDVRSGEATVTGWRSEGGDG